MNDIQKVIAFLNDEIEWLTEQKTNTDTIMGEVYRVIDGDERVRCMTTAISAMQELQQYREKIREIDRLYLEKCQEVNDLSEKLRKLKEGKSDIQEP